MSHRQLLARILHLSLADMQTGRKLRDSEIAMLKYGLTTLIDTKRSIECIDIAKRSESHPETFRKTIKEVLEDELDDDILQEADFDYKEAASKMNREAGADAQRQYYVARIRGAIAQSKYTLSKIASICDVPGSVLSIILKDEFARGVGRGRLEQIYYSIPKLYKGLS